MKPDNGDDSPREYEGIYRWHYECAALRIAVGRWCFGLFRKYESWTLVFARDVPWREMMHPHCRLRFIGKRGPRQPCGHLGHCDRETTVLQILECTKLS